MKVYTRICNFIMPHSCIYWYMRVQNNMKKMHNYRIRTDDLMHTIRRSYHSITSMNTSVL